MNASEKFKPSFNQYFIVHYADTTSIAFDENASTYSDLQLKIRKFEMDNPALKESMIDKIEGIKFNERFSLDMEGKMIELESLLDFSMHGLFPEPHDPREGLIPLLIQLYGLSSKIDVMIDMADKQKVFYEKQQAKES
jgi:hypothetical protein